MTLSGSDWQCIRPCLSSIDVSAPSDAHMQIGMQMTPYTGVLIQACNAGSRSRWMAACTASSRLAMRTKADDGFVSLRQQDP